MRFALECVHRHLPGALHVLHAPIQVGQMLLKYGMPLRPVVVRDQHSDLLEAHTGSFAPQNDRNAYEVVVAVEASVRTVTFRFEKPNGLPMAKNVGFEPKTGGSFAD
ncbi:hypothetical protein J2X11_002160 [Aeromicrobium panaciterrae]|uniref:Uncharacterized protein n=1 Tax=Aeromicrobium panaciterrae TaxID=363861 RepID=A0ABU1UQ61_9ACTN|nr:hypothetical protein [Aeromicrobium panaciterrae]